MPEYDLPVLISIQNAIHLFGLSRSSLYRLLGTQQIRAKKFGRTTLLCSDSLREFIARLPDAQFRNSGSRNAPTR